MKKIVVVGVGGVGMAHVVASVRSGNEIISIVDINNKILEKSKKQWRNEWADVKEEVEVNKKCQYFNKIDDLKKVEFDLCIIATPPESHLSIIGEIRNFYNGNILIEKPASNNKIWLKFKNVYVSSEWIYHSKLNTINNIESLSMQFIKSSTTKWDKYLISAMDFIPHFISVIISKGYEIKNITFNTIDKDSFKGEIETDKNIIKISGNRDSNKGFFVNDEEFEWELELFDRQIINNGIDINKIIPIHNILIERIRNETF